MTYLLTNFFEGGTEEQYKMTRKELTPEGLPDGQLLHAACECDGGFLVSAIWDSKESADRFIQETMIPAMPIDGGFQKPPQPRGGEIVNLVTREEVRA